MDQHLRCVEAPSDAVEGTDFQRNKPQICRFFAKTGCCDYGARCRFSHDLSAKESTSNVRTRSYHRDTSDNPLYNRLRTWKFGIPRTGQPITPLGNTRLQ